MEPGQQLDVKPPRDLRGLEHFLRRVGFTRSDAKSLAFGFKRLKRSDEEQLIDALHELTGLIRAGTQQIREGNDGTD